MHITGRLLINSSIHQLAIDINSTSRDTYSRIRQKPSHHIITITIMSSPQVCFGCASIGKSYTTAEQVTALLHSLSKAGIKHLDTAARYPPTSPGLSEKLLGEAECGKKGEFSVNTKVLISGDGSGSLTETAIGKSLDQSYQSLGVSEVSRTPCQRLRGHC